MPFADVSNWDFTQHWPAQRSAADARVAATVVGAIDKQAAHPHFAHLGKGDFLGAVGHCS
jgi:hypothetical protein